MKIPGRRIRGPGGGENKEQIMSTLFLRKGGRLELTDWDDTSAGSGPGHRETRDVSTTATRFLFTPLELDPDVTLRDLFLLLRANPSLAEVIGGDTATNLVEEGLLSDPANKVTPDQEIEYLEIYRIWDRDTAGGQMGRTDLAHFHGVTPVLSDVVDEPAGLKHPEKTRRHVSVAFSSPMVLVDLPLRVNPLVIVAEADPQAANHGHVLEEIFAPEVPLGQALYAVVRGLTMHGREAMRRAARPDPVDVSLAG